MLLNLAIKGLGTIFSTAASPCMSREGQHLLGNPYLTCPGKQSSRKLSCLLEKEARGSSLVPFRRDNEALSGLSCSSGVLSWRTPELLLAREHADAFPFRRPPGREVYAGLSVLQLRLLGRR